MSGLVVVVSTGGLYKKKVEMRVGETNVRNLAKKELRLFDEDDLKNDGRLGALSGLLLSRWLLRGVLSMSRLLFLRESEK